MTTMCYHLTLPPPHRRKSLATLTSSAPRAPWRRSFARQAPTVPRPLRNTSVHRPTTVSQAHRHPSRELSCMCGVGQPPSPRSLCMVAFWFVRQLQSLDKLPTWHQLRVQISRGCCRDCCLLYHILCPLEVSCCDPCRAHNNRRTSPLTRTAGVQQGVCLPTEPTTCQARQAAASRAPCSPTGCCTSCEGCSA